VIAASIDAAAAARCMHLDRVAADLIHQLEARSVPSLLLRGPAIIRHLYSVAEPRDYADIDLLVAPELNSAAHTVLRENGFELRDEIGRTRDDRPAWSRTWFRTVDGVYVDLHRTIVGADADASTVWAVLSGHAERFELSRRVVRGLDAEATAAVVALHAAQHGSQTSRTLNDLGHALDRLPDASWVAADGIAERLAARPSFAAGLRLLPQGASLAERLALPHQASTAIILRAATAPPTALGFDWLASRPGVTAKATFVARKFVPPVEFMRAWSPLAREGTAGLLAAYAWRPVWLLVHALPGMRAWLEARREARR
jgi:hypothetical protein